MDCTCHEGTDSETGMCSHCWAAECETRADWAAWRSQDS